MTPVSNKALRPITILSTILLAVLLTTSVNAAEQTPIRIYGDAPTYRGHLLVFYQYQNFLSQQPEELFSVLVDTTGHFELTYDLPSTTYAFADLGQLQAHLFLEPGHQYELVLPPYLPLPSVQRFNPFFKPQTIQMGIANNPSENLNQWLQDFNESFDQLFNTNAFQIFSRQDLSKARSIIEKLETQFPYESDYFKQYKKYQYARLVQLADRRRERQLIHQYYSTTPVLFHLPPYWKTFKELFAKTADKFIFDLAEKKISPLSPDSTSFSGLSQDLASDTLFSRADLRESLIVWSLHEAFYEKTLPENSCLIWLKQASQQASSLEIRQIAEDLYHKINQLRPGSLAPSFELPSLKGKTKTLDHYAGKFVYLNFMHTQNYACQKALSALVPIADIYKRDLEVVTILLDDQNDAARTFLTSKLQPKWDVFFLNNSNLIENYQIQAAPTYFLLDPEGKIVLAPAPGPDENFRETFAKQALLYRQKQQRKKPQKARSILDF